MLSGVRRGWRFKETRVLTNTKRSHQDTKHVGIARFLDGSEAPHEQFIRSF